MTPLTRLARELLLAAGFAALGWLAAHTERPEPMRVTSRALSAACPWQLAPVPKGATAADVTPVYGGPSLAGPPDWRGAP
jgi:hypothetical protein